LISKQQRHAFTKSKASVAIVIVLVPIVLGAPAVLVLIPPAVLLTPAAFARFMQFTALVVGLTAIAAVVFDGFVQFVLSMSDTPLAAVDIVGVSSRHCAEQQDGAQDRCCQHRYGWDRQLVKLDHRQRPPWL
jgi:hypothetical protein